MDGLVERQCRLWSLQISGKGIETNSSFLQPVRTAEGSALLKCFKPASDERDSGEILSWFDGVACVRLLRGNRDAQLLEWIDGPSLTDLVHDGRDPDATRILADVANQLHGRRGEPPTGLCCLEQRMAPLFERANGGPQRVVGAGKLARRLLATAERVQPLHGDLHHDNILRHPRRGWLAIDPKGLIGDRRYDFANALFNPLELPDLVRNPDRLLAQAQILSSASALDLDRLLSFCLCHAALSEIWSEEDGLDPTHWRRMGEVIASMIER